MLKSLLRNKELEIKVSLCLLAFFFPPNQGGLENFYLILTDMAGGGGIVCPCTTMLDKSKY